MDDADSSATQAGRVSVKLEGVIAVICPYPNQLIRLGRQAPGVDVLGCGSSCLFVAAKLEPLRDVRGD